VATFLATASVLEGVGVSAYLGAAANITTKAYLTVAGSILTVEARHNAYLRASTKGRPYPQPFDVPLDFNSVYSLAAPFIKSCPSGNPTLPLTPFPAAAAVGTGPFLTGTTLPVTIKVDSPPNPIYAAFMTVTGPVWAHVTGSGGKYEVTIPAGVHGQSYLVFTHSNSSATDDTVVAGPAIIPVSGTDGVTGLI
jgi:hypothetical protein